MKNRIYGYCFAIIPEEGESGYMATAPGVGGVYEEGTTREDAISNAYEAACAILETRIEHNEPITENNPYLIVLTAVPNREYITNILNICNGYIAKPRCLTPAIH